MLKLCLILIIVSDSNPCNHSGSLIIMSIESLLRFLFTSNRMTFITYTTTQTTFTGIHADC